MRIKEWQEMSMAIEKPLAEQSSRPALQVLLGCERNRMHQDIQLSPFPIDAFENRFQLARDWRYPSA